MTYRYRFLPIVVLLVMGFSAIAFADPCLTVYPTGDTVYHYDTTEYYVVGPGDPLYDPMYDRGGYVLIDANTMSIDLSIYQAPNLVGFTPSTDGQDGYFFEGYSFTLVIDGFSNTPRTYENIIVVVTPLPNSCPTNVVIDGNPVVNNMYPIGNLVVSTPTVDGNNYSDTIMLDVSWADCAQMQFWAYADENYNGIKDGGECFSAYSHDTTVPAPSTSVGTFKAMFGTAGQ
jgi:hypothetical protein